VSGFVNVEGLEDTRRDLYDLPEQIVRELFPAALKAGGDVLQAELEARTPKSPDESTSAKEYGTLRADLGSEIEIQEQELTGSVKVGFGKTGYIALFIEYGHRKVTHDGKQVGHTAAVPFMRQAAEAAEDAAVEAFANALSGENK
jgi:hypothetical protein